MFFTPVVRTRAYAPTFGPLERHLERMMSTALQPSQGAPDLDEDEKQWTLRLDVPGISREQLQIHIEGRVVRLETAADAARQYKRAYQLPDEIDATASSAKLENGVLTLVLAKPVSKVTQVTIN